MDNNLYSNFLLKSKKAKLETGEELSLLNLSLLIAEEQVAKAFCNDLKKVLEIEDIAEIAHQLLSIETKLNTLNEDLRFNGKIPSLEHFFRNFSPIFLRALVESVDVNSIEKSAKEAIRIALEEELYIWQDRYLQH